MSTIVWGTGSTSSPSPPSHTEDDLLYLFVETASGTPAASGWTIRASFANAGSTSIHVFERAPVGSGETVSAPTVTGGSDHLWCVIARVRGADTNDPIQALACIYPLTAGTAHILPGVETRDDGQLVAIVLAYSVDNAGPIASGWTNGSLASITEDYDAGTATANGGGICSASGVMTTHGLVRETTVTLASTSIAGFAIAFRDAPTAPAHAVTGTATIAGDPAPDGADLYLVDIDDLVVERVGLMASGDGTYSIPADHDDHDYIVIYSDGTNFGASSPDVSET